MEGGSLPILSAGKIEVVVSLKTVFAGGCAPTWKQLTGGQALGMEGCRCSRAGSAAVPMAVAVGDDSQEPPAPLPHRFTCVCFHSYGEWTFPTLADTYMLFQINIVYHHLHHYCISVSWSFCQSQLLHCGFLMTSHSLRKNCTKGVYLLLRLENKESQTVRPAKEGGN